MALEYLPLMAQSSAPKPPRVLVSSSKPSWCAVEKPVNQSRVALLTSAALRLNRQEPFAPGEDLSYRLIPSNSKASEIVIDHHSRIGPVPRQNPEIVFPMAALASLAAKANRGKLVPDSRFVYGRYSAASRGRKRTRPSDCSRTQAGRR